MLAASLDDDKSVAADDEAVPDIANGAGEGNEDEGVSTLSEEFAAVDALLARSDAAIENAKRPVKSSAGGAAEKIRWSMISTGTRMRGWRNGAV